MKITQIASKPQLVEIKIDDEDTIKEYGEAISFWTWDRQPLDTFMKLAAINQNDPQQIIGIVKTMILDEHGKEVITADTMLPTKVLMRVIQKIVETLGK